MILNTSDISSDTEFVHSDKISPSVIGAPRKILQLEGFSIFVTTTIAAFSIGIDWKLYLALFFVPDIVMLGYLVNRRVGATIYNIGHAYLLPMGLLVVAYLAENNFIVQISLVWIAHIGFDRMLTYGLKYSTGFKSTHLSSSENL